MRSPDLQLSVAIGAPTLADCLTLAIIAVGGPDNIRETSFFDLYTSRSGLIELRDISNSLFLPDSGTVVQIASVLEGEFALLQSPGENLSCWFGAADLRASRSRRRLERMLRAVGALFVTVGLEEAPMPTDTSFAEGRALEGSEDYALVAASRIDPSEHFRIEVNHSLLDCYQDLAFLATIFGRSP